ncbi:MAG TPA: chemotaxis protein CheB [Candidatus Polarisedimenticolaceae bacterium]|nr:chemotaxis protein CheB [Candidatus Polarisedimenticolaceae bacterium]
MARSPLAQPVPLRRRDIVVIGASAGGVEALRDLVRALPPDLPAAVFVVLHLAPGGPSVLPAILQRAGSLPAVHPVHRERILPGRIYVAPPDRHMLLHAGRIRLTVGPRENRSRPAIDPLFRSAAMEFGPRVIGIVLSGALDDGTAGLRAIGEKGGLTVVQDPEEALHPTMPRSALEAVPVDHCLKVAEIANLLAATTSGAGEFESRIGAEELQQPGNDEPPPGVFVCPECHGPLHETDESGVLQFRCRVGHVFSPESLEVEKDADIERNLFLALQLVEDGARLARRLAERASTRGFPASERRFREQARLRDEAASALRRLLVTRAPEAPESEERPETA